MKEISTDQAPEAIGPYSQAVKKGSLLELAGQIGLTPKGELVEGVEEQTHQALSNLEAVLLEAGSGWEDVLKIRIYLTDIETYPKVNGVYEEYFRKPYPARAVVGVKELPRDAHIEIEATAVLD